MRHPETKDEILLRMMPDAFPIFFAGRRAWPAQAAMMPYVVRGTSTLFAAPTASGKTEAAMAPLFQRHRSFRRDRLSTIYVAPTKALANDIFERLDAYLSVRFPGCIARYTGDHHELTVAEDLFCLVVTPEALDSLQLTRPEALSSVRAVVVDEIHLMHGFPRGQQLRYVLDRIRAGARSPHHERDTFQVVGMTATLDRIEDVRDVWLGPHGALVRQGTPREIEMELLDVDLSAQPGDDKAATAARALAHWMRLHAPPKILIFENTRNGAHALVAALDSELRRVIGINALPLHLHIGVLSATERERVELAMKQDRAGICVATSTLEIGIDIGDIDVVVLASPPTSVNAFLQRVGRGNRRSDICRVLAMHEGPDGASMFRALLDCARGGDLDDVHEYDRPSVRFQQVLSQAWFATRNEDGLEPRSLPQRTGGHDHSEVLGDMLSTGALNHGRGVVLPNDALIEEGDKRRIHSVIIGGGGLRVLDARTGEVLTQVADRGQSGGRMYIGGGFRTLDSAQQGPLHLEASNGSARRPLAALPKTRGTRGLSRPIVWALARQQGDDPIVWTWRDGRWMTYGGLAFNTLLAAVLAHHFKGNKWAADDFGVNGPSADPCPPLTLDELKIATATAVSDVSALSDVAKRSVQPSRYRTHLSKDLQDKESRSSLPIAGFLRWVSGCQLQ